MEKALGPEERFRAGQPYEFLSYGCAGFFRLSRILAASCSKEKEENQMIAKLLRRAALFGLGRHTKPYLSSERVVLEKQIIRECANCYHQCLRSSSDSYYPPANTPSEKIRTIISDQAPFSLYCTNPACNCFTIYCRTNQEATYWMSKFDKKPS